MQLSSEVEEMNAKRILDLYCYAISIRYAFVLLTLLL